MAAFFGALLVYGVPITIIPGLGSTMGQALGQLRAQSQFRKTFGNLTEGRILSVGIVRPKKKKTGTGDIDLENLFNVPHPSIFFEHKGSDGKVYRSLQPLNDSRLCCHPSDLPTLETRKKWHRIISRFVKADSVLTLLEDALDTHNRSTLISCLDRLRLQNSEGPGSSSGSILCRVLKSSPNHSQCRIWDTTADLPMGHPSESCGPGIVEDTGFWSKCENRPVYRAVSTAIWLTATPLIVRSLMSRPLFASFWAKGRNTNVIAGFWIVGALFALKWAIGSWKKGYETAVTAGGLGSEGTAGTRVRACDIVESGYEWVEVDEEEERKRCEDL